MHTQKPNYYFLVFKYQGKLVVWLLSNCQTESQARSVGEKKLKQAAIWDVVARPYPDTTRVKQEMMVEWADEAKRPGHSIFGKPPDVVNDKPEVDRCNDL